MVKNEGTPFVRPMPRPVYLLTDDSYRDFLKGELTISPGRGWVSVLDMTDDQKDRYKNDIAETENIFAESWKSKWYVAMVYDRTWAEIKEKRSENDRNWQVEWDD